MKVKRVKRGQAPDSADRIYIDRVGGDEYAWIGSIAVGGVGVFGSSNPHFATYEEAETDAVRWADRHGVSELMIERIDA